MNDKLDNFVADLDFHLDGEVVATIDQDQELLILDVDTNLCNYHLTTNTDGGNGNFNNDYFVLFIIFCSSVSY